jgi:hypothetical protein
MNNEVQTPELLTCPDLDGTLDSLRRNVLAQENILVENREKLAKSGLELSQALEAGTAIPTSASPDSLIDGFREPFARSMAEVGVGLWRIAQSVSRMEESKETRRIQRDLANCMEALKTLGVVIVDRANADLNTGTYRDIEVVTNEVSPDVSSIVVSEVLKPAVHFSVLHNLIRKTREKPDQAPFIIQKCQVVTKSPSISQS